MTNLTRFTKLGHNIRFLSRDVVKRASIHLSLFFIRNYQPSFTFLKFIYRIRNDEFDLFNETRSQYSIFSRDVVKQASIHLSLRREVIQRNFEKSWLT